MKTKTNLIALYAAMIAIANIAAVKVIEVYGFSFTAGVFPFAVAFLISDIIVERYGKKAGHETVWAGVFALLSTILLSQLVLLFPPEETVVDQVFSSSLPILTASIITVILSQHTDVFLFHKIKNSLPYRPTRNIGSTTISQLLDTTVFTVLAFVILPSIVGGTVLPYAVVLSIISIEWLVKVGIAIVDTPAFLFATQNNE